VIGPERERVVASGERRREAPRGRQCPGALVLSAGEVRACLHRAGIEAEGSADELARLVVFAALSVGHAEQVHGARVTRVHLEDRRIELRGGRRVARAMDRQRVAEFSIE